MNDREWDGESIVILDFGSQYTQLIARKVRGEKVFSNILPNSATIEEIRAESPMGIILSGGPATVTESEAPGLEADIFSLGIPILGICYGMQLISVQRGARVDKSDHREFGNTEIRQTASSTPSCHPRRAPMPCCACATRPSPTGCGPYAVIRGK